MSPSARASRIRTSARGGTRRRRTATLVVSYALIAASAASGSAAHGAGSAASSAAAPAAEGGSRFDITLVTGDRVTVDGDGDVTAVEHGEGREGIPISVRRGAKGHTYVVPADAEALLGSGRLDRRLFDATELARPEYRDRLGRGLPLIVSYRGTRERAARADLKAAGTADRRELPALDAQAFTVETADDDAPAGVWKALTEESARKAGTLTTAPGVDRVWLDGVRRASLAESVPQIGAPTAWQAGYTGEGVKVAVLDTGVDETHPDLADAQIGERNFTEDPDAADGNGHGTHVASTVTGSGAKSGGTYTGVAPDAGILDGKVLDAQGFGQDSWIIAGMEWAAEQHADVVNMSLGDDDVPGLDPLEVTVERLSAQPDGPLFVVAAGNTGPSGHTLGSPGTAPSALTVGAVDKQDAIADFSSRGPGNGDYALKPDVTAPGVDITAARASGTGLGDPVDDWYTTLSGTSMATPHVAGAAALLVQEHPGWSGQRVKQALVSSADGRSDAPAFAQGTGRVDLGRAIGQTVVAETSSLSFGLRQWPHHDDEPATQRITYRNTGSRPVTLDLSVRTAGPDGKPGPDGMFTLDAATVTVPADGTASVGLTADTRPGGDVDGDYSAYVTAAGGGQSVRTAAAVVREAEAYDVKIEHTGRDGVDSWQYSTTLFNLDDPRVYVVEGDSGDPAPTLRLPKGRYLLDSRIFTVRDDGTETWDADWIVEPVLTVDGGTGTVTADARTTRPVDVTVPDADARPQDAGIEYMMPVDDQVNLSNGMFVPDLGQLGTAHLGAADPQFKTQLTGLWGNPSSGDLYAVGLGKTGRMFDGVTHHAATSRLARLDVTSGVSVPGREGRVQLGQRLFFDPLLLASDRVGLPYTRRVYVSGGDVPWYVLADQLDPAAEQGESMEADFRTPPTAYKAGRVHPLTFNTGVYGPLLTDREAVARDGDILYGSPSMFADGAGHAGNALYDTARTELYRDGELLAAADEPLRYLETELPPQDAEYRLTTAETHSAGTAVSTRVEAAWTFRSARTDGERVLPLSVVRFTPKLALDSTARAGASLTVPVAVQGAAAGQRPRSLTVGVSTDGGATWRKAPLVNGTHVVVRNPAAGGTVSLRAELTDQAGNTVEQTIIDAYRVR